MRWIWINDCVMVILNWNVHRILPGVTRSCKAVFKNAKPPQAVWSSCETCSPALTNMKKSYSVCPAVFWALCEFKYSGNQIVIRSHPDLYNKSILVYHTKTWRSETRVHFTSKIKWWWNVALDTSQKLFIWICRRLTFTWANWTSACFHWPAGEYLFIYLFS